MMFPVLLAKSFVETTGNVKEILQIRLTSSNVDSVEVGLGVVVPIVKEFIGAEFSCLSCCHSSYSQESLLCNKCLAMCLASVVFREV